MRIDRGKGIFSGSFWGIFSGSFENTYTKDEVDELIGQIVGVKVIEATSEQIHELFEPVSESIVEGE